MKDKQIQNKIFLILPILLIGVNYTYAQLFGGSGGLGGADMGVTCTIAAGAGVCPNIASQSSLNSLASKVAQETSLKKLISNIGGTSQKTIYGSLDNIYNDLETIINNDNAVQNSKNNTLMQMAKIANSYINVAQDKKGPTINISTNGQNFVGNINNYLNKIGANAIKKSLDPANLPNNPYVSVAEKKIIQQIRKQNDESAPTLPLPFIAQKEICNSEKLKNVIKNGEPSSWINPKPALKNVDIDELCNADLTATQSTADQTDEYKVNSWKTPVNKNSSSEDIKNLKNFLFAKNYLSATPSSSAFDQDTADALKAFQKDQGLDETGEVDDLTQTAIYAAEAKKAPVSGKAAQAAWISIANAGYGGSLTNAALADPINTPSGQQTLVQQKINSNKDTDTENAKTEFLANNGVIADTTCIDKNGDVVNFDPTSDNARDSYCFDNVATSTESSAIVKKQNIAIAQQMKTSGLLELKADTRNGNSETASNNNKTGFKDILESFLNEDAEASCSTAVSKSLDDIKKNNLSTISQKVKSAAGSLLGNLVGSTVGNITGSSGLGQTAGNLAQSGSNSLIDNITNQAITNISNASRDLACAQGAAAKKAAQQKLEEATKNAKTSINQIISQSSNNKNITDALQKQINSAIDNANKNINSQANKSAKTATSTDAKNYEDLSKYLDTIMQSLK